jgi:hypothetical protein
MIFEEKERTRTEAKKPGEDEFAFYDSIAGAAYDVYRARLNEWIAEYPNGERAEAVARFRKTGTLGYQARLWRSSWCTQRLSGKVTLLIFIRRAVMPAAGQIFWHETLNVTQWPLLK